MPDENTGRKWNPKDLYKTPEFPDEQRSTVLYEEPANRNKLPTVAMLVGAVLLVALCALILTGVVKLPFALNDSPNGAADGGNAAANVPAPPAGVPVISEIMANNGGALEAGNGKHYDWIEVYNPTDHAVDLSGFALSDDPDKPGKFYLPAYSLGSGEFVIIFASGKKPTKTDIMAPFKLKASGSLLFTDPDGKRIQQIDYPGIPKNRSFMMNMNDFTKWSLTEQYTPGFPNTAEGYGAFQAASTAKPKATQ
jgi:hypothetical protein